MGSYQSTSNPEQHSYVLPENGAYDIPIAKILHVCDENNMRDDINKPVTYAVLTAFLNSRPDALNFVVSCNGYYFNHPHTYEIKHISTPHIHPTISNLHDTLKMHKYLEMAENCTFKDELIFTISYDTNMLFAHLWNMCKHEKNNTIP